MNLHHLAAEKRYHELRVIALQAAHRSLPANDGYADVTLRLLDAAALSASRSWASYPNRQVNWDWAGHYVAFKFRHPKRFELAIWKGGALASLTLGRPTYQGSALRLDAIERSPAIGKSGPKVFWITLISMTVYAEMLGAKELRVMNPINDEVRKYYEGYGLTYVPRGDYLYTRL